MQMNRRSFMQVMAAMAGATIIPLERFLWLEIPDHESVQIANEVIDAPVTDDLPLGYLEIGGKRYAVNGWMLTEYEDRLPLFDGNDVVIGTPKTVDLRNDGWKLEVHTFDAVDEDLIYNTDPQFMRVGMPRTWVSNAIYHAMDYSRGIWASGDVIITQVEYAHDNCIGVIYMLGKGKLQVEWDDATT